MLLNSFQKRICQFMFHSTFGIVCFFFIPATQVGASGVCLMVLSVFLITKEVETHFHMVIGHLYIIFCEVLVQVFCPYFCWVLFVFFKLIYRSYIYSLDLSSCLTYTFHIFLWNFLSHCGLLLQSLNSVSWRTEILPLNRIQLN